LKLGPKTVVITLGEFGAFISDDGSDYCVDTFAVKAIDTTAAGDAFCGALAAAMVRGSDLREAVRYACAAGALATTKLGAEPSLPTAAQIEKLLSVAVPVV
jgi:ribokinase